LGNGDYEYRKIGIFNGMNEYHWMCVFMVYAKTKINIKKSDEINEKMEKIRVLAISPTGRL
jgi:hypothetical protein